MFHLRLTILVNLLLATLFAQTSNAKTVYVYDDLNRLKSAIMTGDNFNISFLYTYDPAGNITRIATDSAASTLAESIVYLQIITGGQPSVIVSGKDSNQDGRLGLEEAIEILNRLSQ